VAMLQLNVPTHCIVGGYADSARMVPTIVPD